ncbi:MAG: WHG domain-containing protein, partial [Nonomuraea sp.]|nr:WHG domain-containing protein [Nonomuraea sp.]
MGRPKVRTEALRGELLSVATGLLSSGGSAALTTRAVAAGAGSSLAAVNELFGGKAGLVRAIFAEGFTRLAEDLSALRPGDDPEADVLALAFAFRAFAHRHPNLYEVMFSRPFAEFRPDEEDLRAAIETRRIVVDRVAALPGVTHPKDAALGLFAVIQGLVGLETAGLLGSTPESVTRRYHLTVSATVRGLTTPPT